jgi:phosphoenolpyruvate-protein kinase (PTS system EI component)
MAGDPLMIPLLLGLGVDELSVAPQAVPQIKYLIRRIKMSEAREIAMAALDSEVSTEILDRSQRLVRSVAPSLFEQ